MSNYSPEIAAEAVKQINPNFKPYARSPLHAFGLPAQARSKDSSRGVWMNELPLLGYIVVRGNSADPLFIQAIQDVLGIALPTTPSTFVPVNQGIVVWQTPDEWLVVCARAAHGNYLAKLTESLSTLHAQVADNSGGLTTVYVSGAKHVELLRHVGVYDFESITDGQAISTICHKANIVALRHDSEGIFVIFRRSFADYFWLLLTKAARPYGLGISVLTPDSSHPLLSFL
ncbi:sarcosine oxidase subunit gamma [Solimicrobium silvestre]|uniref:Sarcosine oxidase gamma subunit n=1 Tax=Solimicrobium silvestre TaxID=2099400 RepID=A0A2S9GW86_9BURK|nr:sarcosine oxidase subunit gamma family protein [Solimicrobium silvestre]PRC91971.1 Sarcosine oxidase gamma subunit [Solimicrobium silvestre]